ncbi:MAG: hypothetical protein REI64_12555 [Pedobacter sp.]|uniref:hypothetical protein n=1 Tax=Pedobacter sp. TaxID=1411316 RepID=UPI002806E9EF|nr:hypothetical protein [Pedobacter sp.]MDQ8005626.1 hypothetical protein [Pedobacter sp.]
MLKSYHPEFLTATILNWQHLLSDDFKHIIIDAMKWLVTQKRCTISFPCWRPRQRAVSILLQKSYQIFYPVFDTSISGVQLHVFEKDVHAIEQFLTEDEALEGS